MEDSIKYAIRIHDKNTENDPELATVIYTTERTDGRWFDMVTGHPEWCEEVLDALQYRANNRHLKEAGYNLIEAELSGSLISWSEAVSHWEHLNE